MKLSILFLSSLLLSGASVYARPSQVDVIYGDDNRRDVFESSDSILVELSRSTAAMIGPENLRLGATEAVVSASTLQARGICATERFARQISAASCSGFLVSPTVLVTAGHCIQDQSDCTRNRWVFDYRVDSADQGAVTVPLSSVYLCKRIISRALDEDTKEDFAVIELDRRVQDRPALAFRRHGQITPGTAVAVIGHPTGLPTKIADGATVREVNSKFFVAGLDTYGGNSGSAVFNHHTDEVEGILVRGENDYVLDPAQGCQVSNRCAQNECRGEDVTSITSIPALKHLR